MNILLRKYKLICGITLLLQMGFCIYLFSKMTYQMDHDNSKGWGGFGMAMQLMLQIPFVLFQLLLFIWSRTGKGKYMAQILIVLTLLTILLNVVAIKLHLGLNYYEL